MSTYSEYVVTVVSKEDKSLVEQELKSSTAKLGRIVSPTQTTSFSKLLYFILTEEEAIQLRKDPKIKAVELIDDPGITIEDEAIQEGDFKYLSNIGTNFSSLFEDGIEGYSNLINYNLAYHSLPKDQLYNGFYGINSLNLIIPPSNDSPSLTQYNYVLDGSGVDLMIFESSFNHLHPEFFDKNGESRVQYIDFPSHLNLGYSISPLYYINEGSGTTSAHSTFVTSLAGGLLNGWAKNSHLYILNVGRASPDNLLEWVKLFHEQKPIDPKTGYKRPTIVNRSQASISQIGTGYERGGIGSASIDMSTFLDNEHLRINFCNQDINFISSTTSSFFSPNQTINERRGVAHFFYYQPLEIESRAEFISNLINSSDFPFTSSFNNNILSLTSSVGSLPSNNYIFTAERELPIKIYKGTEANFKAEEFPYGGTYLTELLGGPEPNSHITKIVVGGEVIAEGENLHLHSDHGMTSLPPIDHFGIDNGWNYPYSPFHTGGRYHSYPTYIDEIYTELAEIGVICVMAAGNRGLPSSCSSSLDNNPFLEDYMVSNYLNSTYFERDITIGSVALANTPIKFLLPNLNSNGSTIQAGLLTNLRGFTLHTPLSPAGIHLSPVSCRGPAVDTFALASYALTASPTNGPYTFNDTVIHPQYAKIQFNSQSVIDFLTENYPIALNESTGPLFHYTLGDSRGGGTSAASPTVAGLVCLYLQINPSANVKDVRNWLRSTNAKVIPNNDNESPQYFLYNNYLTPSTTTPGKLNSFWVESGSQNLYTNGEPGGILYNPYAISSSVQYKNISIKYT